MKYNLIFDIDQTLLNCFNYRPIVLPTRVINNKKIDKIIDTSYEYYFNINVYENGFKYKLFFSIRPYVFTLLRYAYKNFNVSYWTAGTYQYAEKVLKTILTSKQYDETIMIFGRKNKNEFNTYIDVVSKFEIISDGHQDKKNIYPIAKKLSILFNHDYYKNIFNKDNTLIIDDSNTIKKYNPFNSIVIPPYQPFIYDVVLLTILKFVHYLNINKQVSVQQFLENYIFEFNNITLYGKIKKWFSKCFKVGDIVKSKTDKNKYIFGIIWDIQDENIYLIDFNGNILNNTFKKKMLKYF